MGLLPRRVLWGVTLAVVLLDQLSKSWAASAAANAGQPLIPGLLRQQLVFNSGAAFSLFRGAIAPLALLSLAVSVILVVWIQRSDRFRPWRGLGLALVLGGALGNGLDRWRLGVVIDWLELVPITFPVFNLADVAINLAVLCFLLDLVTMEQR